MTTNEIPMYADEERAQPFVTFPNQGLITTLSHSDDIHHQSQQRVYVTVAVQPTNAVANGGGATLVQPSQFQPFTSYTGAPPANATNQPSSSNTPPNTANIVPVARSPAPSTVSNNNDAYNWGPTHPINRASPATVKWLLDNFEQADGVSLPRARMYDHYLFHSQQNTQEPVNAASFGKLVRSVFTGLKTRRLGTRGNSKYHYYGIRIKDNSPLHEIQRDPNFDQMVDKMTPKVTKEKPSRKREGGGGGGASSGTSASDDQNCRDSSRKRLLEFVGDTSSALPDFPSASLLGGGGANGGAVLTLPRGVDEEDIELFEEAYRNHCEEIVETVVNLQFDDLQQLWYRWWQLASEELDGRHLAKEKVLLIFSIDQIAQWIHECDTLLYASLAELLIPNVVRPDLPVTFITHIREFAKLAESWMRQAVENTVESIQTVKLNSVVRFASNLRQLTTLNHLANEFRKTFQQNDTIWPILLRDLEKIDFVKIQDQISWITNCPLDNIQRVSDGLKNLLSTRANVEQWMSFLQDALYHSLPDKAHPNYNHRAAEVIMKWSYYSSMVMRDFTLRSSPQFGSLVIIRMFLDELVTHIIVNKLQKPFFSMKSIDIKSDTQYSPEHQHDSEVVQTTLASSTYITLTTSTAPIVTTAGVSAAAVPSANQNQAEPIQFADQSYAVSFAHQ